MTVKKLTGKSEQFNWFEYNLVDLDNLNLNSSAATKFARQIFLVHLLLFNVSDVCTW
jgi:hypothetical protein